MTILLETLGVHLQLGEGPIAKDIIPGVPNKLTRSKIIPTSYC